jgi:hypothetical protein
MRAVKLKIVKPQETIPAKQKIAWQPALRVTWVVISWLLWTLWEMTKIAVVVAVLVGVFLMVMGILAHFVGGPPRWHD